MISLLSPKIINYVFKHPEIKNSGKIFSQTILTNLREISSVPLKYQQTRAFVAKHWTEPSDHLPIGTLLFGKIKVVTYNILNSKYVSYHKKGEFETSPLIQKEATPSKLYPNLSLREEESFENIQSLIEGKDGADILCIQECSDKMFKFLQDAFAGKNIELSMTDGKMDNHVVTLVKTSPHLQITESWGKVLFNRKYVPKETVTAENPKGIPQFGEDKWRPAECVKMKIKRETGEENTVTVVNLHISCAGEDIDYKQDRAKEVATRVQSLMSETDFLILAGDFNMPSEFFKGTGLDTFQQASPEILGSLTPAGKEPSRLDQVDHILVSSKNGKAKTHTVTSSPFPGKSTAIFYERVIYPATQKIS